MGNHIYHGAGAHLKPVPKKRAYCNDVLRVEKMLFKSWYFSLDEVQRDEFERHFKRVCDETLSIVEFRTLDKLLDWIDEFKAQNNR